MDSKLCTNSIFIRYQIPVLVKAGHKLYLIDIRGFNLSEKPSNPSSYVMYNACTDVIELMKKVRKSETQKFRIIGHDMGGAITYIVG